jgi:hypothetical protein
MLSGLLMLAGCNKTTDIISVNSSQVASVPLPKILNYQCNHAPDYGDSIIYMQPSNHDYIVNPVNAGVLGKGKYVAWPSGLIIDSASGAINVSESETGLRYIIGFIKDGARDTCLSNLILGGITYADGIYVLGNNDTLAIPYYNANAAIPPVCDPSDDYDYPGNSGHGVGNSNCVFDGKDKKGNSGQANGKNVKVRTISGIINLKATLAAGAFGSNPANGTSITVPIAYSLNDESQKATQQIDVQFVYYENKSDIPVALTNNITANRSSFFKNTAILSSPRPPIIIVARFQF